MSSEASEQLANRLKSLLRMTMELLLFMSGAYSNERGRGGGFSNEVLIEFNRSGQAGCLSKHTTPCISALSCASLRLKIAWNSC